MSDYNAKNYTEQGGETSHIGGKLIIDEGGSVEGLPSGSVPIASATNAGVVKVGAGLSIRDSGVLSVSSMTPAANQPDSVATALEGLRADFNSLLSKLKAAGLMEADT